MGTKIYVACEDHSLDQYIVAPVVRAMAQKGLKYGNARVKPITNPRLRGISDVKSAFKSICLKYAPLSQALVFALDLDGETGEAGAGDRKAAFNGLLAQLEEPIRQKVVIILAHQEVEVWACWGSRSQITDGWATVRAHRDPKEVYFQPLVSPADIGTVDGGRTRLVQASLNNGWRPLATACPELAAAEEDLKKVLERSR